MKERIRRITRRNRGVSLARMIVELNLFLVGWIACYRIKQRKRGKPLVGFLQQLRLRHRSHIAWPALEKAGGDYYLSPARVHQAMSEDWAARPILPDSFFLRLPGKRSPAFTTSSARASGSAGSPDLFARSPRPHHSQDCSSRADLSTGRTVPDCRGHTS
jgi:Group II intron, maturase-specific domain